MREIEFKAWLKDEKRMIDVRAIDFDDDGNIISVNYPEGKSYSGYDGDNIELLEFVGLKDKNGVKIFEGYIVKCGKKMAVVKYGYHNCGCCHDVYGFTLLDNNCVTDAFSFEYCEVIGNIYENPELLEVKNECRN